MRNGFKRLLKLIVFLLILVIGLYVFYSIYKDYFVSEAVIETSNVLSINYAEGNKLFVNGSKKVEFTVINSSDDVAYYYIQFKNPLNVPKGKINYVLNGDNDINISKKLNPYSTIVQKYIEIGAGESQNYTLELKGKGKYTFEINVEWEEKEEKTFSEKILEDNKINKTSLTSAGKNIATSDEGLIKYSDEGVIYYFRGNVKNNYVKLDNLMFRIVRINTDGSVKLVLDGELSEQALYLKDLTDISFEKSELAGTLSKWVDTNLKDYKYIITNHKFCNDNTITDGKFLARKRIVDDKLASFNCLGDEVTKNVGLLTADEIVMAGGNTSQENKSFYLYKEGIKTSSYTMTGYDKNESYYPFVLSVSGQLKYDEKANDLHSVRPVINIIKTAFVTGSGTLDDPYILSKD